MSRPDIRDTRRLRKGERIGKEGGREGVKPKKRIVCAQFPLSYFIIYLFILICHPSFNLRRYSRRTLLLGPLLPSRSPGAFPPGAPTYSGQSRGSSLNLLQLSSRFTSHSRPLPSATARISNGVTRCIFDPTSPFIISRLAPRFSFCPGLPVPWQEGTGLLR